jgi:nucleoside-diphosphate-sugar epimerase
VDDNIGMVVVTGASGFIGRRLCKSLVGHGHEVIPVSRNGAVSAGPIDGETNWAHILCHGATVVHLAARAHVQPGGGPEDEHAFHMVNVHGTARLVSEASRAGVRRLVFVSSIGVLGTNTNGRGPFTHLDEPSPVETYAHSKLAGERVVQELGSATGLEICVVRPPLVYGPGAPGNFGRLVSLVRRGLPLPLGAIQNRRSLVALDNLVDLIRLCVIHPAAAGGTFLAGDGGSLSTPDLIREIAGSMQKRALLVPVPLNALRLAGRVMGKSAEVERLVGSLEVDISHTCRTLGWKPPINSIEGVKRAVQCAEADGEVALHSGIRRPRVF